MACFNLQEPTLKMTVIDLPPHLVKKKDKITFYLTPIKRSKKVKNVKSKPPPPPSPVIRPIPKKLSDVEVFKLDLADRLFIEEFNTPPPALKREVARCDFQSPPPVMKKLKRLNSFGEESTPTFSFLDRLDEILLIKNDGLEVTSYDICNF